MKRLASSYGAGLLFGVGLVISGMTDPRNIVGFLDFAGDWKPQLIGVMVGAIAVHAVLLRLFAVRRPGAVAITTPASPSPASLRQEGLPAPRTAPLDARLVVGSAVFGVGWGIAGYCPGPAIVALGFGAGRVWLFVAAVVLGALLADVTVFARWRRRQHVAVAATAASAAGR